MCMVVLHSICTLSTMSDAIAQNMKAVKLRRNLFLAICCLYLKLITLIIVAILYRNNFNWLAAIPIPSGILKQSKV